MIPTVEDVEHYFQSLEQFISLSFSSVPDMNNVREAAYRLWLDVSRYGPQTLPPLPEIIPVLGNFQVPPPPPPPPEPELGFFDKSVHWATEHPWAVSSVVVGLVSGCLLVGYGMRH